MGKHKRNLDLEYLDNKINRLKREFEDFKSLCFRWQRARDKEIDKITNQNENK